VFEEELVEISSAHPEVGIEIESSYLKTLLDHSVVMPISK
jgi:hypothetical protein